MQDIPDIDMQDIQNTQGIQDLQDTQDIPELLMLQNEEIIFSEGIEKRNKFSRFFNTHCTPVINNHLSRFVTHVEKDNSAISFIGGSRAWDKFFHTRQDIYNTLSTIEKNAIIPGNFDIFCVCTDKTQIDNILEQMCLCIDNINYELINNTPEINEMYDISYISNANRENVEINQDSVFQDQELEAFCPITTPFAEEGCVFPKCKAIHLELIFNPLNKKQRKILKKNSFDQKVLLYFEIIYINKDNTDIKELITQNLITSVDENGFHYLNLNGLYLFLEITPSRSKEYNIDLYRSNIITKIYKFYNASMKNVYLNLIKLFINIFQNTEDIKSDNYRVKYDIQLSLLLKKFITLQDEDGNILDQFSSYVTEIFRPYINSFIDSTAKILSDQRNEDGSKKNNYIFIVGGDAYRRYLPDDIRNTNDIDTKLFYNDEKDKNELITLTVNEISDLISILYIHKQDIFSNFKNTAIGFDNKDYDFNIHFIPVYDGGQFRIRYIDADDFILFSLDYRTKIDIELKARDFQLSTSIINEIAILDVVLMKSDLKSDYTVTLSNWLPIASAEYLVSDLKKIYKEISENVKLRFHKSKKDKNRLTSLLKYIKKTQKLFPEIREKLKRKLPQIEIRKQTNNHARKFAKIIKKRNINVDDIEQAIQKMNLNKSQVDNTNVDDINVDDIEQAIQKMNLSKSKVDNTNVDDINVDDINVDDIEQAIQKMNLSKSNVDKNVIIQNKNKIPIIPKIPKILYKNTLDERINYFMYKSLQSNVKKISEKYSNIMLDKLDQNNKKNEHDREHKLKLSFDDIKKLFETDV